MYYNRYEMEMIEREQNFAKSLTKERLAQMIENYNLCDRLTYEERVRLTIYENELRARA